jgi:hypothetical protein
MAMSATPYPNAKCTELLGVAESGPAFKSADQLSSRLCQNSAIQIKDVRGFVSVLATHHIRNQSSPRLKSHSSLTMPPRAKRTGPTEVPENSASKVHRHMTNSYPDIYSSSNRKPRRRLPQSKQHQQSLSPRLQLRMKMHRRQQQTSHMLLNRRRSRARSG